MRFKICLIPRISMKNRRSIVEYMFPQKEKTREVGACVRFGRVMVDGDITNLIEALESQGFQSERTLDQGSTPSANISLRTDEMGLSGPENPQFPRGFPMPSEPQRLGNAAKAVSERILPLTTRTLPPFVRIQNSSLLQSFGRKNGSAVRWSNSLEYAVR